ncbi:hypothetical protein EV189_3405 [Motilibacter rhizosphaerae]|uniref:Uncharacterized protein n=1 Tax=Motilibacter rhizosphaerae TaxID=598652 RepID=A0A4Q7NAL2_9ACTN|nr:hypothetical protein [Motilibacter rhizosphaerae]RZS79926.1 hypothetical protein EV189_3405 [Motilibacter rhizosphaerae]
MPEAPGSGTAGGPPTPDAARIGQQLRTFELDGDGVVLDAALWVRMADSGEIGYIEGNALLGRGRVHIPGSGACEALIDPYRELSELSPLAQAWLDGFLAGSEPSIWEYLGVGPDAYDCTDEEWARYVRFCARARQQGWYDHLDPRPRQGLGRHRGGAGGSGRRAPAALGVRR